ncbi:hypothetical protein Taro_007297, partial [Colocasia esculenta]|nr:hypothetical protein [Colocasia esculenta]
EGSGGIEPAPTPWEGEGVLLWHCRFGHCINVKPILGRVKGTLVTLALSLVVCILLILNIDSPKDASSENNRGRAVAGIV